VNRQAQSLSRFAEHAHTKRGQ